MRCILLVPTFLALLQVRFDPFRALRRVEADLCSQTNNNLVSQAAVMKRYVPLTKRLTHCLRIELKLITLLVMVFPTM